MAIIVVFSVRLPPKIVQQSPEQRIDFVPSQKDITLTCIAEGEPEPE